MSIMDHYSYATRPLVEYNLDLTHNIIFIVFSSLMCLQSMSTSYGISLRKIELNRQFLQSKM